MALAQMPGRIPDAIIECETALRLDPNFEPAAELLQQLKNGQK
jgi:hypothetical protein